MRSGGMRKGREEEQDERRRRERNKKRKFLCHLCVQTREEEDIDKLKLVLIYIIVVF